MTTKRSISSIALLLTSVSAIIGSGWLFSSYYASTMAGPGALLSWLVAGVAIIIVAFVFGEICSMIPVTGSSTRIPHFTHGTVVSFIFSWIIWLSYAALAPTEVQAVIQYLTFYFPSLTHTDAGLTRHGYLVAMYLMLLISTINVYSLRWLIRSNNILTLVKIIIPIFIAIIIITSCFAHGHTLYPTNSSFLPMGIHGMLVAISSGGIVFAFNGFKQAAEMAGEAKKPHFALPFALIGSVTFCLLLFLLLQTAFLSSLTQANVANGWQHINLPDSVSPLAAVLTQNNLNSLLPILYICALIAPLAAALMYCGSSSRSLYGMSKNGYIFSIFQKLNPKGNPVNAIIANFAIGMFMFTPLPGWDSMVSFLSSVLAVTYSIGPVSLLALREQMPEYKRLFRLPFAKVWANLAFYICTLLTFWCGWEIIYKLSIALLVGLIVLVFYQLKPGEHKKIALNWFASIWMWIYFAGLTLISYLGSFGGGKNILPFGWDFVIIALFSIAVMWLALKFKLPAHETAEHINTSLAQN